MKRLNINAKAEFEIYVNFLTGLAIAWFTAGIIGPFFTPVRNVSQFFGSMFATFACFYCLQLAIIYNKKLKKYEQ